MSSGRVETGLAVDADFLDRDDPGQELDPLLDVVLFRIVLEA